VDNCRLDIAERQQRVRQIGVQMAVSRIHAERGSIERKASSERAAPHFELGEVVIWPDCRGLAQSLP
jgi:hypothetical protein